MGIKKYLEEKAKRAALLGLTTATILGGGATLTGCENQEEKNGQVQVDKSNSYPSIEEILEAAKEYNESIDECVNSGGHQYTILEKKDNDGYTDSQVCKDGALYEYICQKCGISFTEDIAPTLHEAMGVDSAKTFGYTTESAICQSCGERIHREYFGENETPWEAFPTR